MSVNHNGTNGGWSQDVVPNPEWTECRTRYTKRLNECCMILIQTLPGGTTVTQDCVHWCHPLPRTAFQEGTMETSNLVKGISCTLRGMSDKETADSGDDDSYINMSSETIDEELKRPIYATCPDTGRKIVKMQFDVHGFESSDIRVKISNRKLIIFALHRENDSGRRRAPQSIVEDWNFQMMQLLSNCNAPSRTQF